MGGAQEEAGAGRTYLYITGGKFGDHMSDDVGGGKYPTAQTLRIPLDGDGEWEAVGNLSTGERTLSAMANLDGTLYHAGGRSLFYPLEYVERYGFTRMGVCCSLDGCVYVCELHACVRACMHPCLHQFAPARMHTHTHASHANKAGTTVPERNGHIRHIRQQIHTHIRHISQQQNRYDVTRAQWDVVCNMTVARRGLGLCVLPGDAAAGVRDLLFAAGGQDDTTSRTVEVFDASTESWRRVAAMGERRVNFGFVALGGHLYAIGGWDGENILQSCEKYYPERDEWVEIAELPQPRCLAQVVAALLMDSCSRLACAHHGSR